MKLFPNQIKPYGPTSRRCLSLFHFSIYSLCSWGPTKIWARSVQPFWRLLDTNRKAKYIFIIKKIKVTWKRSGWKWFLVGSTSITTVPIIINIFPWKIRALTGQNICIHAQRLLQELVFLMKFALSQNPIKILNWWVRVFYRGHLLHLFCKKLDLFQ